MLRIRKMMTAFFVVLVVVILTSSIITLIQRSRAPKKETVSSPENETSQTTTTSQVSQSMAEVVIGKNFFITLPTNQSAGYQWNAKIDEAYLKVVNSTYKDSASGQPGSSGDQTFEFAPQKSGSTQIEFLYSRSWEKGQPPEKTIIYTIKVL